MLSSDDLIDVEGEANAFMSEFGDGSIFELCERITGGPPLFVDQREEGRYDEERGVALRSDLSIERARFTCGHELGHAWLRYTHRQADARTEAWCDAFGARLICERDAFRRALSVVGHSYTQLASHFGVTQSVTLLRIGETTGRPVILFCDSGPHVRGDDFAWPSMSTLVRKMRERRSEFHQVRIFDEPNRWGIMATRDAWRAMVA